MSNLKIVAKEYAWQQKYRPDCMEDIILRESDDTFFKNVIKENRIPDLLLSGTPGIGKTTLALALCKEMNKDYLFLNGKTEGNIDTLKTTVTEFVSTKSLKGNGKVIIFDEGDAASISVLDALKTMMERYSKNATFIITSNHLNKFKPALRSRLHLINFSLSKEEKDTMIKKLVKRIFKILKNENCTIADPKSFVAFVKRSFPDIRHILKSLQMTSIENNGIIPSDICEEYDLYDVDVFKKMLQDWKYNDVVKFVENGNTEMLYLFIQENLKELTKPEQFYDVLRTINVYSFQEAFTTTKLANTMCCLNELREYIK